MVAIPVRVNPPPAEIGETISPTCASFETMMPSNGARMTQLSTACWASAMRRFGADHLLLGQIDFGLEAIHSGARGIELLLGLHSGGLEFLRAMSSISAYFNCT